MSTLHAAPAEPLLPAGLAPEWRFDRDLHCPSCRYNLRMLRDPRCPECGTVFRWQMLLHVMCPRCGQDLRREDGATCPHCRLDLVWERLFDAADLERHGRRYEYTRKPARAMVRTWFAALRPRAFWASIPIELAPAVGRLRAFRAVAFLVALIGLAAVAAVNAAYLPRTLLRVGQWEALVLTLPIVTTLLLPGFVPTLARFRVRREQLLRCLAYATSGLALCGVILLVVAVAAVVVSEWARRFPVKLWPLWGGGVSVTLLKDYIFVSLSDAVAQLFDISGYYVRGNRQVDWISAVTLVAVAGLAFVWWWVFLWRALRDYLRIDAPNALALLLSTQVIGLLTLLWILVQFDDLAFVLGRLTFSA